MENNLNKEKIFIIDKPKSSIAESFKILRTNVQFALKLTIQSQFLLQAQEKVRVKLQFLRI